MVKLTINGQQQNVGIAPCIVLIMKIGDVMEKVRKITIAETEDCDGSMALVLEQHEWGDNPIWYAVNIKSYGYSYDLGENVHKITGYSIDQEEANKIREFLKEEYMVECPHQTFTPDTEFTAERVGCDLLDDELCNINKCTFYLAQKEKDKSIVRCVCGLTVEVNDGVVTHCDCGRGYYGNGDME